MSGHTPVMLAEVLTALQPQDGEVLVDGTYGGGGYAGAILAASNCRLIGLDRDPGAIARAQARAVEEPRLTAVRGCFGEMELLVRDTGVQRVDGVVLDLGVSSFQLDEAARGFSLMRDGPLDMRMGQEGVSAADVVNQLSEADLATIIYRLGDEPQSRRIARALVERRKHAPFQQTLDFAGVVERALGGRRGARTHPATRTFQAIRMFLNDELGQLAEGLRGAERLLKAGGRLVVVTFHSLEDRLVKSFMRTRAQGEVSRSRHLPAGASGPQPSFRLPKRKAVPVSEAETVANPRARSARLRLAIRTEAPAWERAAEEVFDLPSLDRVEARS